VERVPSDAGTHLRATFARSAAEAAIAVLGHYDTVWPSGTAAERPLVIEDGIARGPGLFDMRGGIVAALQAIRLLADLGELRRPVVVVLTADEESGSLTSQQLVEGLADVARTVLIPEPPLPGGALKTARRGLLTYRLTVSGRAAHAGLEPERGISAVHELVGLLAKVRELERPELETTINVGTLSGGVAPNVVAPQATATIDVRVAAVAEYDRIADAFMKLAPVDARVRLEPSLLHARAPMERTPAIADAVAQAGLLAEAAGLTLSEGAAGGASDGNFLAPLGVAVIDGLGPDGGGAHSVDEHVILKSLDDRIVLIALLLGRLDAVESMVRSRTAPEALRARRR
jgi:glutamate carboxypeptidase